MGTEIFLIFLMFIAVSALVIAAKTIKIVPQATVLLIERLGRFSRVATSGLNVIVPFLDKPRGVFWTNVRPGLASIDLREQYIDLPPQPVITRDNVTIHVDSVVYWQITDPIKPQSRAPRARSRRRLRAPRVISNRPSFMPKARRRHVCVTLRPSPRPSRSFRKRCSATATRRST